MKVGARVGVPMDCCTMVVEVTLFPPPRPQEARRRDITSKNHKAFLVMH